MLTSCKSYDGDWPRARTPYAYLLLARVQRSEVLHSERTYFLPPLTTIYCMFQSRHSYDTLAYTYILHGAHLIKAARLL